MKKWLLIFVCGGILFWTWVVLRLTHTLDFYTLRSKANLPTFKTGTIVFASRLKKIGYGNFVCFKLPNKDFTSIFRCIGKAGDLIEIKNTKVYRNSKPLDEPYTDNDYTISQSKLNRVKGYIEQNKNDFEHITDTTYMLTLSNKELKAYHLNLSPIISQKGTLNEEIFVDFKNAGYNEDNFGPVKVPAGCYFLLGDNRHDALDSRYVGFIKKNEIVSTVLNH
jgi:signal peptidase I